MAQAESKREFLLKNNAGKLYVEILGLDVEILPTVTEHADGSVEIGESYVLPDPEYTLSMPFNIFDRFMSELDAFAQTRFPKGRN